MLRYTSILDIRQNFIGKNTVEFESLGKRHGVCERDVWAVPRLKIYGGHLPSPPDSSYGPGGQTVPKSAAARIETD